MITALIGWAILGLVAGAIGRLLIPGRQPMGWLKTMLLGIVGSFAGGFLNYLIRGGELIQSSGWIMSCIGAALVLAIYIWWSRRRV